MAGDLNGNTIGALLAFCDWLMERGYATTTQIEPWKTAIKKVIGTVDGDGYESKSLADVDLQEYVSRFRVLAQAKYKSESVTAYGKRVGKAIEAYEYFLEHQRPPTFRTTVAREDKTAGEKKRAAPTTVKEQPKAAHVAAETDTATGVEFFDFSYPLTSGTMVALRLPKRMSKTDVDRLSAVLRTLQADEQPQIPARTGEELATAA